MNAVDQALEYARGHKADHLGELKELLAIPSISTLPENEGDIQRAAHWLEAQLTKLGMSRVEIMPTGGHPIVYGESLGAPGRPTVLVYGHYDVQPVDPLDEWDSDPFDPTLRDDYIHARGASDMKSQIFAQLKAVEALVAQGDLPINIKYIIEGEEEIGSPNIDAFLESNRELLACDFVLNCDSAIIRPDQPSLVYALRGLAFFELHVEGPAKDLHSGLFGGVVHNPVQVLCELIAGMHDGDGRITLSGFYDAVRDLSTEEREALAQLDRHDEEWREMAGAPALYGEVGFTATERAGARPTLDVNGIVGGFIGEGQKTVLPAKAMAKLSCRLVADQRPKDVAEQMRAYLEKHAPPTVTWRLVEMAGAHPAQTNRDTPWMGAAATALKEVFGVEPVFSRQGGTVPIVSSLKEVLGVDTVMMGFGLPSDGIHGPNERQYLPNFYAGIESYIRFMGSL
jgi:acetylornithine deacetylase/succinyl-diaminopimelate desuccinylase-like protein